MFDGPSIACPAVTRNVSRRSDRPMSIGCRSVREPSRCASLSSRSSERSRQQRRQAVVDCRRPNKANPGIAHGRPKGGSVRSRRARPAGARPGRSAAAELARHGRNRTGVRRPTRAAKPRHSRLPPRCRRARSQRRPTARPLPRRHPPRAHRTPRRLSEPGECRWVSPGWEAA